MTNIIRIVIIVALTFEETREIELLKQNQKKEILRLTNKNAENMHLWRMDELRQEHATVVAGVMGYAEVNQ